MRRIFWGVAISLLLACSSGGSSPSYEDGRADGRVDGRRFSESYSDYTNDQIDQIVDPVVSKKKDQIYSKGRAYGDGWVSGFKDGMRK